MLCNLEIAFSRSRKPPGLWPGLACMSVVLDYSLPFEHDFQNWF